MMPKGKVDHVTLLVPSIDAALHLFRDAFGGEFMNGKDDDELGIRIVHLRFAGLDVELIQRLDGDGPGLQRVMFFVDVRLMDNLVHTKNVPPPEGLLRSRRQEEILALILANPGAEFSLSRLARRLGIPYSSVHREIQRAERFGVVTTRRFENLRLARANVDSPYFASLAALLGR